MMLKRIKTTYTVNQMRIENTRAGNFWFTPESMRFFNSAICGPYYETFDDVYFITSEQDTPRQKKPLFSIRKFDKRTKEVDTVGEFQGYNDQDAAFDALKAMFLNDNK